MFNKQWEKYNRLVRDRQIISSNHEERILIRSIFKALTMTYN